MRRGLLTQAHDDDFTTSIYLLLTHSAQHTPFRLSDLHFLVSFDTPARFVDIGHGTFS